MKLQQGVQLDNVKKWIVSSRLSDKVLAKTL